MDALLCQGALNLLLCAFPEPRRELPAAMDVDADAEPLQRAEGLLRLAQACGGMGRPAVSIHDASSATPIIAAS